MGGRLMSARELLRTLVLAALAEVALLAVFVFLGEPRRLGGSAPRFHAMDLAYLAVPFALTAAAAYTPLRALRRRRSREPV